jgi:hypothetical protein
VNVEGFRHYLQLEHSNRSGRRYSAKMASDCISRCRRVETITGQDMDDLVKGKAPEAILRLIDRCCGESIGRGSLRDLNSATRRYAEYRKLSA